MLQFNLIGPGRLGLNLAFALQQTGTAQLKAICAREHDKARQAVAAIGEGLPVEDIAKLPQADLIFITTQDDVIAQIADSLFTRCNLKSGAIVAHCSGVLSSAELALLKEKGCQIASIHPLKSFLKTTMQSNIFQQCTCMIEGDDQALDLLTDLFGDLGATILAITAEKKSLYHAAAVMASNYLITLADSAMQWFKDAGLSAKAAKEVTLQLMQSSLLNLKNHSRFEEALTGPLARGDVATIDLHLKALENKKRLPFYLEAARATLALTDLPCDTRALLTALLEKEAKSSKP